MAIIDDDDPVKKEFFLSGDIVSILVSLIALPTIAVFCCQRYTKQLTVTTFLVLLSYGSAALYIIAATLLLHVKFPLTDSLCNAFMVVCLVTHNTAKGAEFAFLIERAYIISWPSNSRRQTPEYVLSWVAIFVPYAVTTIVAVVYRITYITNTDMCIIGARWFSMIIMLCVEMLAQVYLTMRFLWPVIEVHRHGDGLLLPLRKVTIRTVVGCAITLLLDLGVKVPLAMFNGIPTWLCFLNCKLEAFLAMCVLHWITTPILTDKKHCHGQQELGVGFEESADEVHKNGSLASNGTSPRQLYLQEVLAHPTKSPQMGRAGSTAGSDAITIVADGTASNKS